MGDLYYGVKTAVQVRQLAKTVVRGLGGDHHVYCQLVETTAVETLMGTYPDKHPDRLGVGLCQHDQIGLDDIQQEGEPRHFDVIARTWGYDIPSLTLSDLAFDPLLSLICCRLSYLRIPERIPSDLVSRAEYWKQYYNTRAGKGTVEEYLERVSACLGEDWQ